MVPLIAVLSLAACGGGGGDPTSAAPASSGPPPGPAPSTPQPSQGTAARVEVVAGNTQVGDAGATLPLKLKVRVADSGGNPVPAAPVQFAVSSGQGTLQSPAVVATDATGMAEATWRLGPLSGLQRVTAQAGNALATFQGVALGPARLPAELPPLAIVSNRDGNREIYRVAADGSNLARLTFDPADDASPSWSPDASRIAFVSDRSGTESIHVMNADGANVRPLLAGRAARDAAWSPDGTLLAFSTLSEGQFRIAVMSPAGGALQFLTNRPGYHGTPSWSPDGRKLALVSDYVAYDFAYHIYTMISDGSELTQRSTGGFIFPSLALFLHPTWSPDGSLLAFVYGRVINRDDVRFTVAVMPADGGPSKDLAWAGDLPLRDLLDPGSLSWSPDGRGLAYTLVDCDLVAGTACVTPKRRSVKYLALDGSEDRVVMENAADPAWHP